MKKILCIIILLQNFHSNAQEFAISRLKLNILYIGVPNPVKVVVGNRPCNDIRLQIDGAEATKSSKDCEYIVNVDKPGVVSIKLFSKKTGELLGEERQRAKYVPDLVLTIGRYKSGQAITKKELAIIPGIIVEIPGFDYDHGFKVHSYTLSILREGNRLFFVKVEEPYFTSNFKEVTKSLMPGDKIFIYDVEIIRKGKVQPHAYPAIFTIK